MWDYLDTPAGVIFFATMGVVFLWLKENASSAKGGQAPRNLRIFALADLVERLDLSENARWTIQFVIFVTLGTLAALAFAKPDNAIHGASAGMGWTAAFSRHTRTR